MGFTAPVMRRRTCRGPLAAPWEALSAHEIAHEACYALWHPGHIPQHGGISIAYSCARAEHASPPGIQSHGTRDSLMLTRRNALIGTATVFALGACQRDEPLPKPRYASPGAQGDMPSYRFAVHPLHNPAKPLEAYGPLITYLNAQIRDAHFELEASRDYQSFEDKVRRLEPAFLLPNPLHTLHAMRNGYRVLAMAGAEEDFRGIFLVRKDSTIRSPADLKGRAVSYPSPTALAACILPQHFLFRAGLDVNRDIENRYVGSQESSIMNVFLGEVAAGATWPLPWRLFQKDHPKEAQQLKVIWQTPQMQNNSVMVRDDVPATLAGRVRELLLSLVEQPGGREILDSMSIRGFYPADEASYRPLERFIAEFERDVRPVELP